MRTFLSVILVVAIGLYLGISLKDASFVEPGDSQENILGSGSETTEVAGGITSLGGLTGVTQTFGDDTNVTMVSAGTTHTLTWAGTLALNRGGWGNDGTATTTRTGGLSVGGGGLQTSAGITISAGRLLATSTATSTILGGLELFSVSASSGITLTNGRFLSNTLSTSTFVGGLDLFSVSASSGVNILGGSLLISSGATSTSNNGFNLSAGCFSIANVCVGGGGGAGTVSAGTVNNLAYYTGATTVGSGNLTLDVANTRLGVGSTSPLAALSVAGQNSQFALAVSTSTLSATTSAFVIDLNGKVGIGTTSPTHHLSINGSVFTKSVPLDPAAAVTVDWSKGNFQEITLNAVTTFTFTNAQPGGAYTLNVCQDATGGRTAVWIASSSLQWRNSDSPPALTTRVGHCDLISFRYVKGTSTPIFFGNASIGY